MIHNLLVVLAMWFLGSIPLGLIIGRLFAGRNRAEDTYWAALYRARVPCPVPVVRSDALQGGVVNPVTAVWPDETGHLP